MSAPRTDESAAPGPPFAEATLDPTAHTTNAVAALAGSVADSLVRRAPDPIRSRTAVAVVAAVLGAALGVALALLVRRLSRPDAPDAQDPDEVEAVIDRPPA